MKSSTYEIAKILNQRDLTVLYNIYLFRCLTIRQIYKNYYSEEISSFEKFSDSKLKQLLELEIVEKVEFNFDNYALFLTSTGVEIVRHQFDLPTNIVDPKKKVESKDVGVIRLNGTETTVKRVYYMKNGIVLEPDSSDSNYRSMLITNPDELKDVHIEGKVVWDMANPYKKKY
ncbi:MAG: S24 family peptidase [Oscillospiraceae bacterium]